MIETANGGFVENLSSLHAVVSGPSTRLPVELSWKDGSRRKVVGEFIPLEPGQHKVGALAFVPCIADHE